MSPTSTAAWTSTAATDGAVVVMTCVLVPSCDDGDDLGQPDVEVSPVSGMRCDRDAVVSAAW